ncbi:hypothetical protein Sfum_2573 [Syntrophobacter fumaroxidans MPOB]|uniref:Uncharacterized protein n=1 Tax=Syntrophobacter fumaroxidans (strain DSM 10017 / MPOB) TaxID=335543 RepID=A0LLE9_SYNFM|nr:hypothetical protein Sfum_2573 [Syntrophobacter fumaroxidans MPOB]
MIGGARQTSRRTAGRGLSCKSGSIHAGRKATPSWGCPAGTAVSARRHDFFPPLLCARGMRRPPPRGVFDLSAFHIIKAWHGALSDIVLNGFFSGTSSRILRIRETQHGMRPWKGLTLERRPGICRRPPRDAADTLRA